MDLARLASIFEAARLVQLRPTDLLVFRTGGDVVIGMEEKALIYQALEAQTGHSRILILDAGAELAVLRTEQEPEAKPAAAGVEILPNGQIKRGTAPGAIA
jgi:hypothetical protein